MEIQCDCGKFKARLNNIKKATTGRLVCYCNDCQNYARKLCRHDLLGPYGGTEAVVVYPSDYEIIEGKDLLVCNLLSPSGASRFSTTCCNTPVANTKQKFPWVSILTKSFENANEGSTEELGNIKSRAFGMYKTDKAPFKISNKVSVKDILIVLPFILKGMILKKYSKSPIYKEDQVTPFCSIKNL